MNARLINIINKNNNKNNNKSKDMITKAFKEFLLCGTLLSVIWLKYFSFITFSEFSLLKQSTNRLKLKASKYIFPLLSNWKKNLRQFKVLAVLCFHRFIIILKLTLQQWFLWLNWTKLKFLSRNCVVSLFHLYLKMYTNNSLWSKIIWPSSSAPSMLYFSQENFTKWKHNHTIFGRYL